MLLKRLIIFLFFTTIVGGIIFLTFWDLPSPSNQIERKIDINRFKNL